MKLQIVFTLTAALLGGALGAVLIDAVQTAPSTAPEGQDPQWSVVEKRLDDLAEQNQGLLAKVQFLEDQAAMALPDPNDLPGHPSALEDEIRVAATLAQEQVFSPNGAPEAFRSEVSKVLTQLRADEEKKRDQRREDARAERMERDLARLAETLGMDPYQTNEMRKVLNQQTEQFTAARDKIRETGDWQAMRDTMGKIRTDSQQAMALFLTPQQVETYDKDQSNRRGGFGRGFGGGRGGDTPGRNGGNNRDNNGGNNRGGGNG